MAVQVGQCVTIVPTAWVNAFDPTGSNHSMSRVLLDTAANVSLISSKLVDLLKLETRQNNFMLIGLGDKSTVSGLSVNLNLQDRDSQNLLQIEAHVVPFIAADEIPPNFDPRVVFPHAYESCEPSDIFPRQGKSEIDILLGQDYLGSVLGHLELANSESEMGPIFWDTIFGRAIMGRVPTDSVVLSPAKVMTVTNKDLMTALDRFWKQEQIGISNNEKYDGWTQCDVDAQELFEKTIQFNSASGRYKVQMLFKGMDRPLNNFPSANKRLLSLLNSLNKDENKKQAYATCMSDYVKDDIAETVPHFLVKKSDVFYLPHSIVTKKDGDKIKYRVVFDASAKGPNGKSLNDHLNKGKVEVNDLLKLLVQFRSFKYAMTADIKKMYLQIEIDKSHRDFLRFLWVNEQGETICFRMKRLTFGIADSAFLATQVCRQHAEKYRNQFPEAAERIVNHRWVDDLVTGTDSLDEAKELVSQISSIMSYCAMDFTKWLSSSDEVMEVIPPEKRGDGKMVLTESTETFAEDRSLKSALGVHWDPRADTLHFKNDILKPEIGKITRRRISADVGSIFDPLGLLLPFSVTAKTLMQRAWAEGTKDDWDKELSPELSRDFITWRVQVPKLAKVVIPRRISRLNSDIKSKQLHIFGDASPLAYAAAVYLRTQYQSGVVEVNLICAKGKTAPSKTQSLPRLELEATVIAARLGKNVTKHIDMPEIETFLWTDSAITFAWMQKPHSHWEVYVANRVKAINDTLPSAQIRHVPGVLNPSDLGTRGIAAAELVSNDFWFHGPEFLFRDNKFWPKIPADSKEMDLGVRKAQILVLRVSTFEQDPFLQILQKFSCLAKICRITAYAMKFLDKEMRHEVLVLTKKDVDTALFHFIKIFQLHYFNEEMTTLESGQNLKGSNQFKMLNLFLDKSGFVRVGGRIERSELTYDQKFPCLIPHKSQLARLLILDLHSTHYHCGPEWTLYHLRMSGLYMIKGRRKVSEVLRTCVLCQRWKNSLLSQKMAPLPASRLRRAHPFQHIGLDFAGPTIVQWHQGQRLKAWIAIFTCFVTRAVHIECCLDMTADTFIFALRRLWARRGVSETIKSDNAKTFKKADADMSALYDAIHHPRVQGVMHSSHCRWTYSTEGAPWHGGVFERMVRSVKEALRRTIGSAVLTSDQLVTSLAEIECIINSRPLIDVKTDNDDPLPISPNQLIYGRDLTMLPMSSKVKIIPGKEEITKIWKQRLELNQKFWNSWTKDYLLELAKETKWHDVTSPVKVGDLVLVSDENKKRGIWPLAKVIQTQTGRDGLVRSVLLKTENGEMRRPVQKLVKLEVHNNHSEQINI